jgi:WD40 repeat protein
VELAELKGHEGTVESVAFSPDGGRILTGSTDNTARLWDAKTGAELMRVKGPAEAIASVAFSPEGARFITGSGTVLGRPGDNTARLWDAKTGVELAELKGHKARVLSIAFSPDGARVITGSWDNTVRLWDIKSGQALIDYAKSRLSRCLTDAQRKTFYLPAEPPSWCIEMAKWPYHTQAWKDWFAAKRAGKTLPPLKE